MTNPEARVSKEAKDSCRRPLQFLGHSFNYDYLLALPNLLRHNPRVSWACCYTLRVDHDRLKPGNGSKAFGTAIVLPEKVKEQHTP
jgi:hypothetical protein